MRHVFFLEWKRDRAPWHYGVTSGRLLSALVLARSMYDILDALHVAYGLVNHCNISFCLVSVLLGLLSKSSYFYGHLICFMYRNIK